MSSQTVTATDYTGKQTQRIPYDRIIYADDENAQYKSLFYGSVGFSISTVPSRVFYFNGDSAVYVGFSSAKELLQACKRFVQEILFPQNANQRNTLCITNLAVNLSLDEELNNLITDDYKENTETLPDEKEFFNIITQELVRNRKDNAFPPFLTKITFSLEPTKEALAENMPFLNSITQYFTSVP
jgi:hypothetical protein